MTRRGTHWNTLTEPVIGLSATLEQSRTSVLKPLVWLFTSSVVYGLVLFIQMMRVQLPLPIEIDLGLLWGVFSFATILNAGALVVLVLAAAAVAIALQRFIPLGLSIRSAASLAAHISLPFVVRFAFLTAIASFVDPIHLAGLVTRLSVMDPFAAWVMVLAWVAARRALRLRAGHALALAGAWGVILGAGPMAGGWLFLGLSS